MATFIPMTWLAMKCVLLFSKQRNYLKTKHQQTKTIVNVKQRKLIMSQTSNSSFGTSDTKVTNTSLNTSQQTLQLTQEMNLNSKEDEADVDVVDYIGALNRVKDIRNKANNAENNESNDNGETNKEKNTIIINDGQESSPSPSIEGTGAITGAFRHPAMTNMIPAKRDSVSINENGMSNTSFGKLAITQTTLNSQKFAHGTQATGTVKPKLARLSHVMSRKYIYNPKHSRAVFYSVNTLLIFVSLFYLAFGSCFIAFVFTHFETSKNKCSNPKTYVLIEHPELYLWDQCLYKTYPFQRIDFWSTSDDDINCNCRTAKIDLSVFDSTWSIVDSATATDEDTKYNSSNSEFTTTVTTTGDNLLDERFAELYNDSVGCNNMNDICILLESVLIHWDMLEILYMIDDDARFTINLNDPNHYNSKHLQMLHLEEVKVSSFGENIDNWANLQLIFIHFTCTL